MTTSRAERRRSSGGNGTTGQPSPSSALPKRDLRPLDTIAESQGPIDRVTLSSGVTFRIKRYNRLFIRDILATVPEPEPPTVYNDEQGVTEVNAQDPEYQEQRVEAFQRRAVLLMDYLLMAATELHPDYPLPDGTPPPESDEWLAMAEHVGYQFDPRRLTRYLAWVKLMAVHSIEDSTRLSLAIARLNGTLEEDVARAVAAFPGNVAG